MNSAMDVENEIHAMSVLGSDVNVQRLIKLNRYFAYYRQMVKR
jgi:hypothetical protein